jgi:hypothetical protein
VERRYEEVAISEIPVDCVCGGGEGSGEVEHAGGMMRLTCPCGICSPWEASFDIAYRSWNDLQGGLRRVGEVELFAWDALYQGADVEDDVVDNRCMSAWEQLTGYFADRGYLKSINARLFRLVRHPRADQDE